MVVVTIKLTLCVFDCYENSSHKKVRILLEIRLKFK